MVLLVLTACRQVPFEQVETAEFGLYLQCPGAPSGTRADEGPVPARSEEYALHRLQVWVFTSDTHIPVYQMDISGNQLPTPGHVRRYAIPVSREFAQVRPDVDVFALANGDSIGDPLSSGSSWGEVNDALFGGSWFGTSSPVKSVDPDLGLPMTGVGRDLSIEGEEPTLRVSTVTLVRAVSKIRYVFCRMKDENNTNPDQISVDQVVLNGSLIPVSEYLFTNGQPFAIGPDGYELPTVVTTCPAGVTGLAQNETPEKLAWAGQDAVTYETMLDNAVEEGTLTDWGGIYFRESDKVLAGRIDYTINGEQSSRTFSMAAAGDFARNHTWTLYGYFLSGRNLQLSIHAQPWDYSAWKINFSDDAVTATQFSVDRTTADVTEPTKDHFDVRLRPGTTAKGSLTISTPVGGKLMIRPSGDAYAFSVEPEIADIDPTANGGRIDISVRRNPNAEGNLSGKFITLSFYVEIGEREIDAESEILNGKVFRFIL